MPTDLTRNEYKYEKKPRSVSQLSQFDKCPFSWKGPEDQALDRGPLRLRRADEARLLLDIHRKEAMTEYGPDSPRPWDPNHRLLKSPLAPHETAGIMRAYRAGRRGPELMKILKLRGTALMNQMQRAMDQERAASDRGVAIYDAAIDPEKAKS